MVSREQLVSLPSATGFPENQDGQIKALLGIGVPANLVLPVLENPGRFPAYLEGKLVDMVGPGEDEIIPYSSASLDPVGFITGAGTVNISGSFSARPEFQLTSVTWYYWGPEETAANEVENTLELLTVDVTETEPESWMFSFTTSTDNLVEGSRVYVRFAGTITGGQPLAFNTPSETVTVMLA